VTKDQNFDEFSSIAFDVNGKIWLGANYNPGLAKVIIYSPTNNSYEVLIKQPRKTEFYFSGHLWIYLLR
jgi:hypothetical protein